MDLKAQQLINELLEFDLPDSTRKELEEDLKAYPVAYLSYQKMRAEFSAVFPSEDIETNPYLFQKIKLRIEDRPTLSIFQRHSWLPYAAIISFGVMSGVLLGNQVIVNEDNEIEQVSDFTISEYEFEDAYLIGFEDD